MCLAKAYLGGKEEKDLLAEEVTSITVNNGEMTLTTLFGEKKSIDARIREIDFRASHILLEKTTD